MRIFYLLLLATVTFWCSATENLASLPTAQIEHVVGVCELVANPKNGKRNPTLISPDYAAGSYIRDYLGNKDINPSYVGAITKISVTQSPAHGEFLTVTNQNAIEIFGENIGDDVGYAYIPSPNYDGQDKLIIHAQVESYGIIKVVYFLHMLDRGQTAGEEFSDWDSVQGNNPCGNGKGAYTVWKIH